MEQWKKKLRELGDKWFEGELTVPKTELWLVLISCFLMGMLYGLKKAPMTHGVTIGSNNGNSFGCCPGRRGAAKAGNAEEESRDSGKETCSENRQDDEGHKCHNKKRCCRKNK